MLRGVSVLMITLLIEMLSSVMFSNYACNMDKWGSEVEDEGMVINMICLGLCVHTNVTCSYPFRFV